MAQGRSVLLQILATSRLQIRLLGLFMGAWMAVTPFASVEAAPGLVGGDVTAGPGDEVFVPVDFDADGSAVALQFDLVFDALALDATAATQGSALVDHVLDFQAIAPGRARIVVTSNSLAPLVGGRLADLRFQVSAQASPGVYPVQIEAVRIADAQAQALTPTPLVDGSVEVESPVVNPPPAAPPSGAATVPVPGLAAPAMVLLGLLVLGLAWVFLRHGARGVVLSFMTASVLLSSIVRAQVLAGDANGDGVVDALDIPVIVNQIQERAEAPGNPDCNEDELVDVLDTVCVQAPEDNAAPVLSAIADQQILVDQPFTLTASATDADLPGDTLTFSLDVAPAGMSIGAASGQVSWTPGMAQLGAHPVTVRVSDAANAFDTEGFQLTVFEPVIEGNAPQLVAPGNRVIEAQAAFSTTLFATDPDPGDVLTFSLDAGPAGMSVDPGTGALSWNPGLDVVGVHPVTARVTDSAGLTDAKGFQVEVTLPVARARSNTLPTLVVPGDQELLVTDTLIVSASATDPDPGSTLAFSLVNAPAGMSIDAGDGQMTWSPDEEDVGQHDVAVQVTDNVGAAAFGSFIVTVRDINRSPLAVDDVYEARLGETLVIAASGVLENDSDPNGDALSAALVTDADQGELSLQSDGSFTYRLEPTETDETVELELWCGNSLAEGDRYQTNGTPAVGDVDNDGTVEIVGAGWVYGRSFLAEMWIMNAEDCTQQFHTTEAVEVAGGFDGETEFGLLDIDGDGDLEIIGSRERFPFDEGGNFDDDHLMALHHDGSFAWGGNHGTETSTLITSTSNYSDAAPTFADIDADGTPEIIMAFSNGFSYNTYSGLVVYNAEDGSIQWEFLSDFRQGDSHIQKVPYIADLDLDGTMEIIVHNSVVSHEGVLEFELPSDPAAGTATPGHLFLGIANFDDDPYPELIGRDYQNHYLFEHDGTVKWKHTFPKIAANQINVADFDGDGAPEFSYVTCTEVIYANCSWQFLAVYDTDGSLQWSHEGDTELQIDRYWANSVSATAFDANGDGAFDLVMRNDSVHSRRLYIIDGRDGSVLDSVNAENYHGTDRSTVVADINGDGHAEIINSYTGGIQGHTDIWTGAADNPLPRAPAMRNQFNFNESYVNEDFTVPTNPVPHWLQPGGNGFNMIRKAPDPLVGTTARFQYAASDGELDSNTATVTLDILPAGNPPVFLSEPDTLTTRGFPYAYAPIVVDADLGDTVRFLLTAGPPGMTLDPTTGALSWTPGLVGEFDVSILAYDTIGYATDQAFVLEVGEPVVVPDVIGMDRSAADAALDTAHLVVGRARQATHPTAPAGTVFQQSPPAGSVAPFGGDVDLALSLGPSPADRDDDADGSTPNEGDCDDADPAVHPGAADAEGDGVDQDCDGVDGSRPVESILVLPGALTLLQGESRLLQAWAQFADGSAQNVTSTVDWASSSDAIATLNGAGLLRTVAPGVVTVTAQHSSVTGSATVTVESRDPADDEAPRAEIISPTDGETLFGPTDITGSVEDDALVRWELAFSDAGIEQFTVIAAGTDAVSEAVLGTLDPTLMLNGLVTLRLQVLDAGGNVSEDRVEVLLDGGMKVGHFTLTFEDLSVPLDGIPIVVERQYDSRDKRVGAFGTGWRLGVESLEVVCSDRLSEGWYVTRSGLSFGLLETANHACSVRLPGAGQEFFDLVVSPDRSPIVPFPPSAIRASLVARSNTRGTLRLRGNDTLTLFEPQPGPVTLSDDQTGLPWSPEGFEYETEDGTRFSLNAEGVLERVEDRNGNVLEITPEGMTHSSGAAIQFTRNGRGRITSLTDPAGHVQTYAYDSNGDLVRHTDATGASTVFQYDAARNLVNATDALGVRAVLNEYDDDGRLIATTDAKGNRVEFSLDLDARQSVTTDPFGHRKVLAFDDAGNIVSEEQVVTIEGVPVVARTTYTHDDEGNQTGSTDPDGVEKAFSYDAEGFLTQVATRATGGDLAVSLVYDAEGRIASRGEVDGRVTQMAYDARGNLTTSGDQSGAMTRFNYDERGRLTAIIDPNGNQERREYDAMGRVARVDEFDADGSHRARMDYEYDPVGNLVRTTAFTDPASGAGPVTRTYVYDGAGRRTEATDAAGNTWQYEYDAAGQMVAEVDPFGERTEYVYDRSGELSETHFADGSVTRSVFDAMGNLESVEDQGGRITRYEYDEAGRRIATVGPDGSRNVTIYTPGGRVAATIDATGARTDYEYDDAGRQVVERGPLVDVNLSGVFERPEEHTVWDAFNRPVEKSDGLGNAIQFHYDAVGREIGRTLADGAEIHRAFDHNDNVISTVDPMGLETRYFYDGANRLVRVEQPPPEPQLAEATVTSNRYDALGNLVAQTDASGRVTRFVHNVLGEVTRRILPGGQVESFELERELRIWRTTDFDGRVTEIERDELHRPVERRFADGVVEAVEYTPTGQLSLMMGEHGETRYTYDALDRLVESVQPSGASVAYTHSTRGEVLSVAVDGEVVVEYDYDALGRLVLVETDQGVTRYGYDLAGNQTVIEEANGTRTERIFDAMRRMTQVSVFDSSSGLLQQLDYEYDPAGTRLAVHELDGSQESYGYDQLNRLVSRTRTGTGATSERFELDAVGNRTRIVDSQGDRSLSYDANDRLLAVGDIRYAYNATGQRIRRLQGLSQSEYEWNDRGRLVSIEAGTGRLDFDYDTAGNRIRKSDDSGSVSYVLDTAGISDLVQVIETREPDDTVRSRFTMGTDLLHENRDGETQFFHAAALGSTVLTTEEDGATGVPHRYSSYGVPETSQSDSLSYGFTGQAWDEESGLQYLRARYYDPEAGVFLSEDPLLGALADPISRHRYLYASSNPVNFLDPTGEYSIAELSLGQAISNTMKASTALELFCLAAGAAKNTATLQSLANLGANIGHYALTGKLGKGAKVTLADINDPTSRVGINKLKVELDAKGSLSVEAKGGSSPTVRFKVNLKSGKVTGQTPSELDVPLIKYNSCGLGLETKLKLIGKTDKGVGKVTDMSLDEGLQSIRRGPLGFRITGQVTFVSAKSKEWVFMELPPDGIDGVLGDIEKGKAVFLQTRYQTFD